MRKYIMYNFLLYFKSESYNLNYEKYKIVFRLIKKLIK